MFNQAKRAIKHHGIKNITKSGSGVGRNNRNPMGAKSKLRQKKVGGKRLKERRCL